MNFLGVGPTELLIVLIVALVIFGPEKLPEIARKLGESTHDFKKQFDGMSEEMNRHLETVKQLSDAQMLTPYEAEMPSVPPAPADASTPAKDLAPEVSPSSGDSSQA